MTTSSILQQKMALLWALPVLLVIFLTGCDSILDKKPLGEQTAQTFFETEEHAIQATNATYSMGRDWNIHVFAWIGMTDIASDDADKGENDNPGHFLDQVDNFTFGADNIAFSGTWDGYYRGIYRANQAITNIPDIDMDEELRDRLVAENKFLRAYYYFFLVRAYGGVPLITEPLGPDEYDQTRASAVEVYELIERDLLEAIDDLPEKSEYASADLGRATKGAARSLLAKAYLFQDDFANAEDYARDVIESNEYDLYDDYETLFLEEGENSVESVFEIQSTSLETGEGGSQYNQIQGVRGEPNLGWGFNLPTRDLQAAYEPGDFRQGATTLFIWEILPDGADVVRANPTMVDDVRYNQKAYVSPNQPGGQDNGPGNIRRIRYADVLLIGAEAAYENGNTGDAQTWLNQVRERARQGQTATIGAVVEDLSYIIADTIGMSDTERPFIRWVNEGGPAEDAGLEEIDWNLFDSDSKILVNNLDLIEAVNGTDVTSREEFLDEMETVSSGETVDLDILRVTQTQTNGTRDTSTEELTITVEAAELLPDVTASGQALLDAIWHERRVELAMEQHRHFDLIRQGRAAEVYQDHGKNFEEGKHELYPIPSGEIQLSNGELQQNPQY